MDVQIDGPDPQDMSRITWAATHDEMQKESDEQVNKLEQLISFIHGEAPDVSGHREYAVEAAVLFGSPELLTLPAHCFVAGNERYEAAIEGFFDKTREALLRFWEHLKAMVRHVIDWFKGLFEKKKDKTPDSKKVTTILDKVVGDRQLTVILGQENVSNVGNEDFRPANGGSRLAKMFENYKDTLTDKEVDFLTSGTYYRNIQLLVKDWNQGRYPSFISSLQADIDRWTDEGLSRTKHVGKDVRVVKEFRDEMQESGNKFMQDHARAFMNIRHMEEMHQNTRTAGNLHRLHEFLAKPSALFPHISNLWKTIHFESMTEDDRQLIRSLEEIEQSYDVRIKHMRERSSVDKMIWPAEDAFLQLCAKINQDALRHITILTRISDVIKHSAINAFNATNKSFAYIRHLLQQIRMQPNVDRKEVERCLQSIDERHRELQALVSY